MAGFPAKRRATYEDLRSVPADRIGEIIDGELHVMPRPSSRSTTAASILGAELTGPFWFGRGGPGGWIILDEPEIHVEGEAAFPDLAGWRRARMPEVPDVAAFELAPDWVCEVLSLSTEAYDRGEKMPMYARWGVQHAWLVDPAIKTLEIFRRLDGAWLLVGTQAGGKRVRAEPFDAIELDLSLLWAR